jgi:hypothetical protein
MSLGLCAILERGATSREAFDLFSADLQCELDVRNRTLAFGSIAGYPEVKRSRHNIHPGSVTIRKQNGGNLIGFTLFTNPVWGPKIHYRWLVSLFHSHFNLILSLLVRYELNLQVLQND